VCIGHDKEGYSMAWSPHDEGMLLTGSEDRTVKLWDVRPALAPKASAGTQISATSTFCGHSDIVEDVAWHAKDRHMMGSVGDDRQICLWDTRKPDAPAYHVANAHDEDINCIAFNPFNEFVFATGSADKTVAIWDMRNLSQYVQSTRNVSWLYHSLYARPDTFFVHF
jgi:histone-binding protein RBBP4